MAGLDTLKKFDGGGSTAAAPAAAAVEAIQPDDVTVKYQPDKKTGLTDKIGLSSTETENILAQMQKYIEERNSPMQQISHALNRGVATTYGPSALAAIDRQKNLEDQQLMGYQQQMAAFRAAQEQARNDATKFNALFGGGKDGEFKPTAEAVAKYGSAVLNDPDLQRRVSIARTASEKMAVIDEASKKEFENRSKSRYDAGWHKQEDFFIPGKGTQKLSAEQFASFPPEFQEQIKQATLKNLGFVPQAATLVAREQSGQAPKASGRAVEIAKELGIPVISGVRSQLQQAELRHHRGPNGEWLTKEGRPVAENSKHLTGEAIDVGAITEDQRKKLISAGFFQPLPDKDPNHWEYRGTAVSAAPAQQAPAPLATAKPVAAQAPSATPPVSAAPAQQAPAVPQPSAAPAPAAGPAPAAAAPKPAAPGVPGAGPAAPAAPGGAAPAAPAVAAKPVTPPPVVPAAQISPAAAPKPPVSAAPAQQAPAAVPAAAPAPAAPPPPPAAAPGEIARPDYSKARSPAEEADMRREYESKLAEEKEKRIKSAESNMEPIKKEAENFMARSDQRALTVRKNENDYLGQVINKWSGNKNVAGVFNDPTFGNALAVALKNGVQTPGGGISLPNVQEIMQRVAPDATKEEIEAAKEINRLMGKRILDVVQQTKGSSSDKDWAAYQAIAGNTDNGWGALHKMQRYDEAVIDTDTKERQMFNKTFNGTHFDYGKHINNPDRTKLHSDLGNKLAEINRTDYTKREKTPNRPSFIPPGATGVMYNPSTKEWGWTENGKFVKRKAD